MKVIITAAALAAACLATASTASAAERYMTVGYGNTTMDFASVGGDEAKLGVVTGRLGYKSDNIIGVEGELGVGVTEDSIAPGVDVKITTVAAVYGVAHIPAGERLTLLARVGYGRLIGEIEAGGGTGETEEGAVAYGVGAVFNFDATNGLRVDYSRLDIEDIDTASWTVSFVRKF